MFILVIETHMHVLILFNYHKDSLKRTLKKKSVSHYLKRNFLIIYIEWRNKVILNFYKVW